MGTIDAQKYEENIDRVADASAFADTIDFVQKKPPKLVDHSLMTPWADTMTQIAARDRKKDPVTKEEVDELAKRLAAETFGHIQSENFAPSDTESESEGESEGAEEITVINKRSFDVARHYMTSVDQETADVYCRVCGRCLTIDAHQQRILCECTVDQIVDAYHDAASKDHDLGLFGKKKMWNACDDAGICEKELRGAVDGRMPTA
jgi:hypothetical protein